MKISINELIKSTGAEIIKKETEGDFLTEISTDTRTIREGDFYLPLRGENFDGESFLDSAEHAIGCFITKDEYPKFMKVVLKVEDTKLAYLKIAEGCSNCCTYCAIPSIRGKYISRKMEDILKEANELAEKGYEEIIIIAQDTTKYGIDLYGEEKLTELLRKISNIDKIKWVRFLYAYPESITEELITEVKNNAKICKYFDIPIQHISDKVLKKMNRSVVCCGNIGEPLSSALERIKPKDILLMEISDQIGRASCRERV